MANENVPSPATTRSDDQILLFNAWVPIGKGNHVLDLQKKQRNPIFRSMWILCITQTSSELSLHQLMFLPALQRQLKQHQHFHHHHLHYNNQQFIEIFGRSFRNSDACYYDPEKYEYVGPKVTTSQEGNTSQQG
ncbi:hypothetical protein Tco_1018565 [Tanacetum coccineum]|uniref:Uncharacterized protein n=1 Tax=Tanacetum coccineum TaxID=301880 RepID=A0ABQ5FUQ6_9ASTR